MPDPLAWLLAVRLQMGPQGVFIAMTKRREMSSAELDSHIGLSTSLSRQRAKRRSNSPGTLLRARCNDSVTEDISMFDISPFL